jgi:hypothetical protein
MSHTPSGGNGGNQQPEAASGCWKAPQGVMLRHRLLVRNCATHYSSMNKEDKDTGRGNVWYSANTGAAWFPKAVAVIALLAALSCQDRGVEGGAVDGLLEAETRLGPETALLDFVRPRDLGSGAGIHVLLDRGTGQIARIDDSLKVRSVWGRLGEGPNELLDPSAVAVLRGDTIAVLDRGRRSVRYWVQGSPVATTRLLPGPLPVSLEPGPDGEACWPGSSAFMDCAGPEREIESKGFPPPPLDTPGLLFPPLIRLGLDGAWYRYENDRTRLYRLEDGHPVEISLPPHLSSALGIPPSVFERPSRTIDLGRGGVADFVVMESGEVLFALQHPKTAEMIHWSPSSGSWKSFADPREDPGILRITLSRSGLFALRPGSLTRYPMPRGEHP